MNGDKVNFNDLMFVPLKGSDIRFEPIRATSSPTSAIIFTEAQQQDAFENYIKSII